MVETAENGHGCMKVSRSPLSVLTATTGQMSHIYESNA